MNEIAIGVTGLRKSYGDLEAVRGIDLEVREGEIVALLGPNGAGKTTTVEILEGYRSRDGGEVEVLGVDPAHATAEWRGRLGMVLQSCQVEPELTVGESLELFAGYARSPRPVTEVLELVGLSTLSRRRAGALSGGEQRRLDVGIGLVGDPELLFLDEPTTGFDPAARHQFWAVIRGLRALGKTVLLTTHYIEEAQALADRVAIMNAGLVVAAGTPADLGGRDVAPTRVTFSLPTGTALTDLPAALGQAREALPGVVELEIDSPVAALGALMSWAADHEYDLAEAYARETEMSSARLLWHQFRFDQKRFRRDPAGLFYGVGFPLIFLVVFFGVLGGHDESATIAGHTVSNKLYYLAGIMTMTVVSMTFVNLAVSLTDSRERGTLKRVRGTRLPPWVFMASRIATAVVAITAIVAVVGLIGWAAYGVDVPALPIVGALLALVVAVAAFSALALALTVVLPSANAAAAITMTLTLVLYFLSGLFVREDIIPEDMRTIAGVFPVKRLFAALVVAYDPATSGVAIQWTDLAVMAVWGIGGLLIALSFFRWTGRGG